MKKFRKPLLLSCVLLPFTALAQNSYNPVLKHVTIYSQGAQVNRTASVSVKAGEQTISFKGISPYTDTKSLQINAGSNVTILGVSHHYAFPDSVSLSDNIRQAERNLTLAQRKVDELKKERKVLENQLEIVRQNCSVSNRTVATPLENIKQLNRYYYDEVMTINKKILALDDDDRKAQVEVNLCQTLRDSVIGVRPKRMMVVDVKIDAKNAAQANFNIRYYTAGASWYPTYEIRANNTSEPIKLTYKANISQQTNELWRQANVTLSSANPNHSNVLPELKPYWLDYGLSAPSYEIGGFDNNHVSGTVRDDSGEVLIGATVKVKGTNVATVTDFDGKFDLTLPSNAKELEVAYIGYKNLTRKINGSDLDIRLEQDNQALNEVVVVGYGTSRATDDYLPGVQTTRRTPKPAKAKRVEQTNDLDVSSSVAKFGYDFEIHHPLTIPSGNKPTVSSIGTYTVPAEYTYRSVPKIDKSAFLVADVTGWDNLNLIEGEASVFYDNSFVGKTVLNPDMSTDTLHLSMGRDQGIKIERKLVKSNSSHKLLASNQEQSLDWEINVVNTRKEDVTLRVYDQIPVSQNSDIKVNVKELSEGVLDKEKGIVYWDLHLSSQENKKLRLSYLVKYGKYRKLNVE